MIKFKYFWLRNRSQIKNRSGGKKDLPFLNFALFCPFFGVFGSKLDPKKAGSNFFGIVWMSFNVLHDLPKGRTFFLAKYAISLFLGVWPLNRGPGGPGGSEDGKFSLPPTFGHRASMFSRKNWGGSKFFPKKGLSDSEIVLKDYCWLSNSIPVYPLSKHDICLVELSKTLLQAIYQYTLYMGPKVGIWGANLHFRPN